MYIVRLDEIKLIIPYPMPIVKKVPRPSEWSGLLELVWRALGLSGFDALRRFVLDSNLVDTIDQIGVRVYVTTT